MSVGAMTATPGERQPAESIGEAVARAAPRLAAAGIDEARREARLLVGLALGVTQETVLGFPERELGAAEAARLATLVARRATREPLSRLIGRREFWSLDFALSPATLDPRPDSETLIEAALARLPDRTARLNVLDLGTGSGCLLLALLSELPNAIGLGVDISPAAAAAARCNAITLGFADRAHFVAGRWGGAVGMKADVILANPPYIESGDIDALAPEVALYEPRGALDGGIDGLDAYRELAQELPRLLGSGGMVFLEVGEGQATRVAALMAPVLAMIEIRRDLSGIERCVALARR